MNTAYIMLASNDFPVQNIDRAIEMLADHFEVADQSSVMQTKPVGALYTADFHNMALKIFSDDNADDTIAIFKMVEQMLGRNADSKLKGLIPIDIDLIIWNDKVVHPDYERFDFVKNCIDEIR
jgi:2-amino-4-hydroxy-6-hydroxymethyldihydropteridine diphosphokinase